MNEMGSCMTGFKENFETTMEVSDELVMDGRRFGVLEVTA